MMDQGSSMHVPISSHLPYLPACEGKKKCHEQLELWKCQVLCTIYLTTEVAVALYSLLRSQRPATVVVAPLEALPRGPGFDPPRGRISALGLKKTLPLVPRPKHCGARPNSQGDGPPCTGGAGVRGFSWPAVRRSFYLSNNAVGAVSPS